MSSKCNKKYELAFENLCNIERQCISLQKMKLFRNSIEMKSILVTAMLAMLHYGIVTAQEVKWYTIEQAVELARQEPRKLVVDVYTDWCVWCKVMDKNTFGNDTIAEYLNVKYYPVKLNAEQKEDITIGDQTYKFVAQGARGYHELAAILLNGNMGYPSVVFLDEQIRIIQPFQGYIRARQFDQIARFFGEEYYKTQTWEDFIKAYQSPIPEEETVNQ
jgi:thioredoxin-related protein